MRASLIAVGVIALTAAGSAGATHHPRHATHHAAASSHVAHRHDKTPRPTVSPGGIGIPAGGIKLYCGPGRSPLMVRKMTQGAGTTVTVICR